MLLNPLAGCHAQLTGTEIKKILLFEPRNQCPRVKGSQILLKVVPVSEKIRKMWGKECVKNQSRLVTSNFKKFRQATELKDLKIYD